MLRKTPGSQEVAATPQQAIHVNIWKTETSSQGVAPVSLVNLKTGNCQDTLGTVRICWQSLTAVSPQLQ